VYIHYINLDSFFNNLQSNQHSVTQPCEDLQLYFNGHIMNILLSSFYPLNQTILLMTVSYSFSYIVDRQSDVPLDTAISKLACLIYDGLGMYAVVILYA
jgi:hypothetical protein